MLLDTSLLTEETRQKLIDSKFLHISNGDRPITEEQALKLLELFSDENMKKYLKTKGLI